MANQGHLPEEVMVEILSRLPLESLLRFNCVAKSWYALINHSKFVGFLRILLKRTLTNKETGKKETRFSFLKYPLTADDHTSVEVEDDDFPCFGGGISEFRNPLSFSRLSLHLPFPQRPFSSSIRRPESSASSRRRFFSSLKSPIRSKNSIRSPTPLDSGTIQNLRDFEVVRVVDFMEPPSNFHPSRAEVYDLGKDRWREIETPVRGHAWWGPSFQMYSIIGGPKLK